MLCLLPGTAKWSKKGDIFMNSCLAPFAGGSLECCVTSVYTGRQLWAKIFSIFSDLCTQWSLGAWLLARNQSNALSHCGPAKISSDLVVTNLWLVLSTVSHSTANFLTVKWQLRGGTRAEKKMGKKTKMGNIYFYTTWTERKKKQPKLRDIH